MLGSKTVALLLALCVVVSGIMAQPLLEEGHEGEALQQQPEDYYNADLLDRLLARTQKREDLAGVAPIKRWRSCIRRGGTCDHRPNDCCYQSSCRCNLWGTNCRCQRMGLFQQWGK